MGQPPSKDGVPAAKPKSPSQALIEAAQLGDVEEVDSLLARGTDLETRNQALLVAARSEPVVLGRLKNSSTSSTPQ